jgi:CheY-like chemotaxis protein
MSGMHVGPHMEEAQFAAANVHRLQPLRVLLCGHDRRFVRVTCFLLRRKGYDVAAAPPDNTVDAAQRHRADVVLLESGGSRAVAARRVAALAALRTAPSVLVVTDENEDGRWKGIRTVEKWTPLDALVETIEAAALNRDAPTVEVGRRAR